MTIAEHNEAWFEAMRANKNKMQDQEVQVGPMRDFIYRITQDDARSPMSEAEIEEIARCALRGGYKFDIKSFTESFGRWKLGLDI